MEVFRRTDVTSKSSPNLRRQIPLINCRILVYFFLFIWKVKAKLKVGFLSTSEMAKQT
jgi:hypothetical protein